MADDDYDSWSGDRKRMQAQSDADTLMQHQQIIGNPGRHQAAQDELTSRHAKTKGALGESRRRLKKGLERAFPKEAPFQKASGNQPTPFTKAAKGNGNISST
jgi:hypothetical protein